MYTMLVVDDERLLCEGMRNVLNKQGLFHVLVAEDGRAALAILSERAVDAMLLDISMPVMDGIELMRRLKGRANNPLTIIISGYEEFDYAKQALSYGAVDYVLKPVDSQDVLSMAERLYQLVLDKHKAASAEESPKPETSETEQGRRAADRSRAYIEAHLSEPSLSVNLLSEKLNYSPNYLGSVFKRAFGVSVNNFINAARIAEAMRLMDETGLLAYEIAFQVGYADQHYFSRMFKKHAGMTPTAYKHRNR